MNNQYLDVFLEEAREHIENLNRFLLELEQNPSQDIIDEIFRSAHTIKGMAGTMGFTQMSELTHEMENLLQDLRSQKMEVTPELIDTLLACVDIIEELTTDISENATESQRDIQDIVQKLKGKVFTGEKSTQKSAPNLSAKTHDFNEYEERLIKEAFEAELKVWEISITLAKDCLLKAARAFLVFKALEDIGEIIKTIPIVQDIEDEKFDDKFKIYLITSKDKDYIDKVLASISEVELIEIDAIERGSLELKAAQEVSAAVELDKKNSPNDQPAKHIGNLKRTSKTIRVDIDRLDILMNLVSELIIIKTRLDDLDDKNEDHRRREAIEYLERITSSLHDAVMKVRMVPIENVFNRFPRVVHDLSRELSKKISLVIEGAETELDRTIIDEIGDPLIHLIRNAADHGIESPAERAAKGKPQEGTIKLEAYHDGNNVVIEVSDDGKGINLSGVLKKALSKGLVDNEQSKNLKESEITALLFEPGFSTKAKVTDVSGRGVGLDVVKTKIESLGGSIEIKMKQDKGTIFLIRLPLTLAIIQALMVMVGDEKYAIPLSAIKETVTISKDEVKRVQKNEVVLLRGNVIPLVRLKDMLNIQGKREDVQDLTLVIVKKGERDIGLVVDNLIGQQEIVIKTLGNFLKNISFIAGATILGDGTVALILDINNLV